MENKTKLIENKVKILIEIARNNFTEWNHSHELRLARIDGMLEALSILTGKDYYYDENGLHEKQ